MAGRASRAARLRRPRLGRDEALVVVAAARFGFGSLGVGLRVRVSGFGA